MNAAHHLTVDPVHCHVCAHAGDGHERSCPNGATPEIVVPSLPAWLRDWAAPSGAKVIPIETARRGRRQGLSGPGR